MMKRNAGNRELRPFQAQGQSLPREGTFVLYEVFLSSSPALPCTSVIVVSLASMSAAQSAAPTVIVNIRKEVDRRGKLLTGVRKGEQD